MLPVDGAPHARLGTAQRVTDRPRGLTDAADRAGFEETVEESHGWRIPLGCAGRPGGSATLAPVPPETAGVVVSTPRNDWWLTLAPGSRKMAETDRAPRDRD